MISPIIILASEWLHGYHINTCTCTNALHVVHVHVCRFTCINNKYAICKA